MKVTRPHPRPPEVYSITLTTVELERLARILQSASERLRPFLVKADWEFLLAAAANLAPVIDH